MMRDERLIFEKTVEGRIGYSLPENDVPVVDLEASYPGQILRKKAPEIPEVSEVDVIRHYTNLSKRNYGVDSGFYPLGSCTMKYNPKINEDIAITGILKSLLILFNSLTLLSVFCLSPNLSL